MNPYFDQLDTVGDTRYDFLLVDGSTISGRADEVTEAGLIKVISHSKTPNVYLLNAAHVVQVHPFS